MNEFLKEAKDGLTRLEAYRNIHVVLCNPSCDLDSAVCSVVYGCALSKLEDSQDLVLPVLNVPRVDYPLKTEVKYQFQKHEIGDELLIFRDEVSLEKIKNLKLHLVDHHVLSEADRGLDERVIEVVDHRPKARQFPSSTKVTLELVGSCCTLVAEVLTRECAHLLATDPKLASLLQGTIILDTCNFSETAKRGTPKDRNMVERLESYLPAVNREDIHRTLVGARADTQALTTCQLLKKDLKSVNNVAIPSIPMLIQSFWMREDAVESLEAIVNTFGCQAVVVLGLELKEHNVTRQLAVYSSNTVYKDRIIESLSNCNSPSLELESTSVGEDCPRFVMFHQGNSTASRKIILPIVQSIDFSSENEPVINPEIQEPSSPLPCPNGLNPRTLQQAAHYLGEQTFSSGSSSNHTSCPYTPLNSCADDGFTHRDHTLPSFNSRDMVEKIRLKRGKLQGYESTTLGCESTLPSCPFTPANSFVESTLDHMYSQKSGETETLNEELLLRKLEEKHLYEEDDIKSPNPIIKVPECDVDWDPHSATSLSTYKTCLSNGDTLEDNPRSEISEDATEADQSFQLDLDLPSEGYCPETVEFPSSPGEMRKLTVVPEEDLQSSVGDDDADTSTYRAVLSPSQPHVRLTKGKLSSERSRTAIEVDSKEDTLEDYYEDWNLPGTCEFVMSRHWSFRKRVKAALTKSPLQVGRDVGQVVLHSTPVANPGDDFSTDISRIGDDDDVMLPGEPLKDRYMLTAPILDKSSRSVISPLESLNESILEETHIDRLSSDPSVDEKILSVRSLADRDGRTFQGVFEESAFDPSSGSSERPTNMPKKKKRIVVPASVLSGEVDETASISQQLDSDTELDLDLLTPDDLETPDDFDDSIMDRLDQSSEREPEMSVNEELAEERNWRSVFIAGIERRIDCKVIEPYKKVLSHGGYLKEDSHLAIIVFSACYLPDRSRKDYSYVMDNLFLYCLTTLDHLVAEDYVLVYLHGATRRSCMPTFGWLRRAYQMIDHRLRKNLKGLYLTHPTFWLKTIVALTKPFVSTKFSRKLRFVRSLDELSRLIPLDQVVIPDRVKQYDEIRKSLQL